jgi:DNA-binding MarR family transcriptional regulator
MRSEKTTRLAEAGKPGRLLSARLIMLVTLIRRTAALTYRRELGLSEVDWRIVSQVGEFAPLSLNELADVIGLDRGQLSRGVTRLVAAGLLTRTARRGGPGILIGLTARGEDIFVHLMELAHRRNAAFIDGIDAGDLRTFSAVLERMTENARALLAAEQDATKDRGRATEAVAPSQP